VEPEAKRDDGGHRRISAGPIASQRAVRGFETYARGAAVAVILIGVLVLVGWTWRIDWLTSIMPGGAQMKPNTAFGFVVAGLALLASRSGAAPLLRPAGWLSLLLLALGMATLHQFLHDVDLGIDSLLVNPGWPPSDPLTGARMSQLTALAFALLGLLGMVRNHVVVQALAMLVLLLALFALGAASYALGSSDRFIGLNPIAVHTAFCLLLLALGWLASRPESGMMRAVSADSLGGSLARYALLPALLIPSLLSYLAQLVQSQGWLSPAATVVTLAVSSGLALALMIWWVSDLIDRVERQRKLAHELRDTADSDALTGLGNRRLFDRALAGLLQNRRRNDGQFSLLMLDLDRFKSYNDTYGHLAGDEALRLTGRILLHALRPGDVATRYGGEEFAVLLPRVDAERAALVAERICADFRAHRWPNRQVTVSIGVSEAAPEDGAEALIGRADKALYMAKEAGRDRVEVVLPELGEASARTA
jgi:diguanylate cyclase (GGDEF)-like protein